MSTFYVGPGGSDSNAGTSYVLRFLTLTKAETAATSAGDTVYISPGTYREQITLGASGGNAYSTGTVTATNGSTTITGSGTTFTGGNVVAGYYFKVVGCAPKLISAVNTSTEIILAEAYDGPTVVGATYITYNPVKWIGDYSGANTDGVGGIVRWTGSADDITAARSYCIVATSISYRHFTAIHFDTTLSSHITNSNPQYWLINKCYFTQGTTGGSTVGSSIAIAGASQLGVAIQNCYFGPHNGYNLPAIVWYHSSALNNIGHVLCNSVFEGNLGGALMVWSVGDCLVKNCVFGGYFVCVQVIAAVNSGHPLLVYNSIFNNGIISLAGTATTDITEDWNNFYTFSTVRSNTNVGANSTSYVPNVDSRWWFETTL